MRPARALSRRWLAVSPALRGRLWMVLSGVCFSTMIACVRHVGEGELHPFEVVFFRNVFAILVLTPFFLRNGLGVFRTRHVGLHLLRSGLQAYFMLATFTAVTLVPLAQFTALSFSAPLFAAIGAVLLLKEAPEPRRFAMLFVGFLGVLVVVRPGAVALDAGVILVVTSSAVWAGILLTIRALARTDSSVTITAWFACLMTVFTFPAALHVWQWPSPEQLAWLALIGCIGTAAHLSLAQAMRASEAGAVLPFDFLRLVWASVIGYVAFAQVPDLWTWLGGAVIFASATWLAVREAREKAGTIQPAGTRS